MSDYPTRKYHALRVEGALMVHRENTYGRLSVLPHRRDLRSHSTTGFECGYEGSGPAQLALALVADATRDDELALSVYQDYKRRVVGRLQAPFTLDAEEVRAIAHAIYREHHPEPDPNVALAALPSPEASLSGAPLAGTGIAHAHEPPAEHPPAGVRGHGQDA